MTKIKRFFRLLVAYARGDVRTVPIRSISEAYARKVDIHVLCFYLQKNGRYIYERWKLNYIDDSGRYHLQSVDRPQVCIRRNPMNLLPA